MGGYQLELSTLVNSVSINKHFKVAVGKSVHKTPAFLQALLLSHLLQNFPQFIVIHTVKGFGIVNKPEIDVFLELSYFFDDPADVGNLVSVSSAYLKTA